MLASLYSERANRAGAPFSSPFSPSHPVSVPLSLFPALLPVQLSAPSISRLPSPSFACCTYCHVLLLLQCTPFITSTSSSPPSPTLTFQLRVPALPRSHSNHTLFSSLPPTAPTVCSPVQPRISLSASLSIRIFSLALSARPSSVIFDPCPARFNPLPFSILIILLLRSSFRRSIFLQSLFSSIRLGLHSCLWIFVHLKAPASRPCVSLSAFR